MKSSYFNKKVPPELPGIYIFRDYKKRPLYIGRATSLRDRVKSYFSSDLVVTRGPRIIDMVTKARSADWLQTDSILEAIILESAYIKKYQPPYNVDERDDKSAQYVIITNEEWPRVFLVRARDFDQDLKEGTLSYPVKKYFGPFLQSGLIQESMKILRKMFPFRDKKSFDRRHEYFYRTIGRSPEYSSAKAHEHYMETIKYLILFFEGKKKKLRSRIEREMLACADKMQFEHASHLKKLLYALDHINDVSLVKERRINGKHFRIEAYDLAHLSGSNLVGAMITSISGEFSKNDYRRFKLSKEANDDIRGLKEVLSRRFNHTEWHYPDLIVVDGGMTHAKHAEDVLKARRIAIPVVAVTKDKRHRAARIVGSPAVIKEFRREIIAANSECHRFAIAYHRKRRAITSGLNQTSTGYPQEKLRNVK